MTEFTVQHTPSTPVTADGLRPGTATARALSLQCLWLTGHVTTPHMSAYKHHTLPVLPFAPPPMHLITNTPTLVHALTG